MARVRALACTHLVHWAPDVATAEIGRPQVRQHADAAGCGSACEGGAAPGKSCSGFAMLTLVRSTLTLEVHSVIDESTCDKDQFPEGGGFSLSNGMRMAVRSRRSTE